MRRWRRRGRRRSRRGRGKRKRGRKRRKTAVLVTYANLSNEKKGT